MTWMLFVATAPRAAPMWTKRVPISSSRESPRRSTTPARQLERRGTTRVKAMLERGARRTRSGNERRLLRIIRDAGLPLPRTNVPVHGFEVDALWPEHGLVVEVDDYFTHGDRAAFVRDRRRDAALQARGLTTLRLASADLDGPPRVAAVLAAALAR